MLSQKSLKNIIAKSYCPYCKKAVETLAQSGVSSPKVIQLDEVSDGESQHEYLKEKTQQRTVPSIFINKKHIGGNSDLQELKSNGELDKLLKN
ncbi:thioredoxin-like protein [Phakopsora pachyrhizi]|uniref:Thioredoxin-like protein n=1 Tax=Phakopsora pachyrhizi TaxID=170000 RepID=A0AAV0AQN7_PHAPC|nr:thioredoxin-like protein [Phakopsora pachyrhizi]